MNKSSIKSFLFVLFILLNTLTNAQTLTWPFGEQGGDSLYMQPENFWAVGSDSTDVRLFSAFAENGTKFHYGWIDGANFTDGTTEIDSVSNVGQGWWAQNDGQNLSAIAYNADTVLSRFHNNNFFEIGYPFSTGNNYGLVGMSTVRSNGSIFTHTTAFTFRNENNLSLNKEFYLTNYAGGGEVTSSFEILSENKVALHIKNLALNSMKLFSAITVVNGAVTGGTEISLDSVPSFGYFDKAVLIIDLATNHVTGRVVSDDYFTTKSLGEAGHVDIIHGDTTITFKWYDNNGDSISTLVDDIPVYDSWGNNVSNGFNPDYSLITNDSNIYLVTGRRGNSIYNFNLIGSQITLTTDNLITSSSDYHNNFFSKNNYLYALRSDEMNYHVDVYDLSVGPNAFVTHFRNDIMNNGLIEHELGPPDYFNIDVHGDSVSVSFGFEASADATMSIGKMDNFQANANKTMSFSYDFVLPDNPLITVDGYEVTYSSPNLEYITHAGFHRDTLFVSPNTDLQNLVITINSSDSISSYLMYEDKYYLAPYNIDPILSGSTSDFSVYKGRIIQVSNRDLPYSQKADIYHQYNYCVVKAPDADSNGLSDFSEGILDSLDTDLDGILDYLDPDNDNDGYTDIEEINEGAPADPNNNDEDGDGVINESHEDDDDNDGLANAFDDTNNIGVSENNLNLSVLSKPGSIFVESSVHISIILTDALGKNHGEFKGNSIEIHNLNQGVYFIQINSKKGIVNKKVLVY